MTVTRKHVIDEKPEEIPFRRIAQHHGIPGNFSQGDGRPGRQPVFDRQNGDRRFGYKTPGLELRMRERTQHETSVELVARQFDLLPLRADILQLKLDIGIAAGELVHDLRHYLHRRKGHIPDPERSGLAFYRDPRGLNRSDDLIAHQPRAFVKYFSGGGQRHFAGRAPDQLIPQKTLQLANPSAERALINGQPVGGPAETKLDRDGVEGLNVP